MNAEDLESPCVEYRDELLRLTCGDIAAPSDALRAHLDACRTCRESVAAGRELVRSLQVALKPRPLPDDLVARIHTRLDMAPTPIRTIWTPKVRVACTVAAAAALTAVLVPWSLRTHSPATTGPKPAEISLSAEDASTIVAAVTFLDWDCLEYSVEALEEQIDDIANTVEGGTGATTLLPWGRDDDWDVPAEDAGRAGLRSPPVCAAPRWADSVCPAAA